MGKKYDDNEKKVEVEAMRGKEKNEYVHPNTTKEKENTIKTNLNH